MCVVMHKSKVVRSGGGVETRPTPLSRVRIRTKGQLDNGTTIDRHSSIPFTLGDGDVLQGVCVCVCVCVACVCIGRYISLWEGNEMCMRVGVCMQPSSASERANIVV